MCSRSRPMAGKCRFRATAVVFLLVTKWRDLFYTTERQEILRLRYTIRNGTFTPGQPVLWTERRFADTGVVAGVDLAANGKRFVALMPAEPAGRQQSPNHVTILLNFFDEIPASCGSERVSRGQ